MSDDLRQTSPDADLRSRDRWRWIHRLSLAALAWLTAGMLAAGGPPAYQANDLKAAFLYNFTKYVEWPPGRFASRTAPIVIGIVGRNPIGAELARIVAGRQSNGRPLVVRVITSSAEAATVHVLFVPAGEEHLFAELQAASPRASILTVGESARFSALGGIIILLREADHIRFAINREAAERDHLKISAQLLKLATPAGGKS